MERAAGPTRGSQRGRDRMDGLSAPRLGWVRVRGLERGPGCGRVRLRRGLSAVAAAPRVAARGPLGPGVRVDGPGAADLGGLGRWVPRPSVLRRRCGVRPGCRNLAD